MHTQFLKFSAVGVVNTLIDLGVVNLLMALTGVSSGIGFAAMKGVSYVAANVNSYFMNKRWTFRSGSAVSKREYGVYFTVSLIGAGINVGVASAVVELIARPELVSGPLWATFASLVGTAFLMIWNFFSYKFYVFNDER